ncbi:hypothetical protein [Streptomyces sp. NPDC005859]|uniref:hypothetical protein n=1 Tax=Streptomyces sp. NPDC005859 TaxID=3157170 RepID=UPI0033E8FF7D
MIRRRKAVCWLSALIAATLTAGCAGSSRTDEDYRSKAANTAEAAASAVNTALIGVHAAGRGRVAGPYVSTLLGEAESDLLAAQDTFESRQPPSERADAVRERLGTVLQDAADALADLRIAARRGGVRDLPRKAGTLPGVAERLDRLETELSS